MYSRFYFSGYPALLLLKREEIETAKKRGDSVVAAVRVTGSALARRAYIEGLLDFMYGFRGTEGDLPLLSPYEMLMQYAMVEVKRPHASDNETQFCFD